MSDHVAGLKIRYLRKKKGLSLQQVADHLQRSVGFVSQIERGISRPARQDLEAIAALLEVDYSSLFSERQGASHPLVVRSGERATIDYRPGINDQLLSPHIAGNFHMLLTEIAPGASSADQPSREESGEQGGLILQGELELTVNGETLQLQAGDSFKFASTDPHLYINRSENITQVVWVISMR